MKKTLLSNLMVALSGLLYTFLFWRESMGLNSFLFSIFLLTTLSLISPNIWQSRRVIFMGTATVFSAILVVWHHSFLAKFTHMVSLFLFIGFVQARELRFIWYAFLLGISSLFSTPIVIWKQFKSPGTNKPKLKAFVYWLKLVLLPLFISSIFFIIYYQANVHFAGMMDRVWASLARLFTLNWSLGQVFLFLLGATIMMSLLWPSMAARYFRVKDRRRILNLNRKRGNNAKRFIGVNALRHEFWRAKLTIGLLNGLLFVVNITDLRYVWVEYKAVSAVQLKQYVHEGTYLLIFAILMAMLVLLYFFRKNLNFFPNNKGLVYLANLWILQNAILVLSVGHRNYQYISQYGLAYKRLAVIFFLLLVIFGLFTLYLKVKHKRSLFYLFLLNGWALYITFLSTSLINWDLVITRYNLTAIPTERIDSYFLTHDLSDKNLFIFEKNKKQLSESHQWEIGHIENMVKEKRLRFEYRIQHQSWKSWNIADWRNKRRLRQ